MICATEQKNTHQKRKRSNPDPAETTRAAGEIPCSPVREGGAERGKGLRSAGETRQSAGRHCHARERVCKAREGSVQRGNASAMRGKAPYGAGTCLQYAGRGHHPAGELFIR